FPTRRSSDLRLVRRQRALAAFGGRGATLTSASPPRQIVKVALVLVACLALAAALLGPEIGETPRRATSGTVDTVIALDVSQSMAAQDVAPDRLHVAQQAIEEIGRDLAGARLGLTLFAGTSVTRYPLTADTKIVGPALDTSGRGFRMNAGSSLRAALQGAASLFPTDAAANARPKAIVLVSDGEDLSSELPLIEPLRQRNIAVFTLGVGTPEGAPVPIYDQSNKFIQFIVDANGTQVISKLDEGRLQSLATAAGGRYWRYQGDATAQELANTLRAIDAGSSATIGGVTPEDRYQIFLAIAVAALLVEWLLDERRPRSRSISRTPTPSSATTTERSCSTPADSTTPKARRGRPPSTTAATPFSGRVGCSTRARRTWRRCDSTRPIATPSSTSRSSTASCGRWSRPFPGQWAQRRRRRRLGLASRAAEPAGRPAPAESESPRGPRRPAHREPHRARRRRACRP